MFFKKKQELDPDTFYDRLAREGLLEDYLKERMAGKLALDDKFREEMFAILLKYSVKPSVGIESHYLAKMVESLSYFLEYTKQWRS